MAEISKPDYRYVWASGGANVLPSTTKIQTGWTSEVPPYQWENALQNRQDNMLVHINQHGLPQWDALTEYFANKSYTLGSDGLVYKAVQNSGPNTTTQDPITDTTDTYWKLAFLDQDIANSLYLAKSQNGADIPNKSTFRSNIGVYSSTIVTVGAVSNINLTTGAPDTTQITISGSGVTINSFTVGANRTYVVKFSGSNTLVNSASIVTNSGSNIVTSAGDSCIIRSTAPNTVEVLCFVPAGGWAQSTFGAFGVSWHKKLPGGLIMQGGSGSYSNNDVISFSTPFPNGIMSLAVMEGSADASATNMHVVGYNASAVTLSSWTMLMRSISSATTGTTNLSYIAIGW